MVRKNMPRIEYYKYFIIKVCGYYEQITMQKTFAKTWKNL